VLYCFRGITSLGETLREGCRLQAQTAAVAGDPTAARTARAEDAREKGIMRIPGEKFTKCSELRS